MKHQAQNLVNCFLSSDFSEFYGAGLSGFSGTETDLYFNNMRIIYFNDGDLILYGGINQFATCELINLLPDYTAIIKNGNIFINGIQWDGKKTKLSIFKN